MPIANVVGLSILNFVFLAIAILALFHYAYRQRILLRQMTVLRARAEKYRALVEASSDGVFRVESSGRFSMINPAGAIMLGYASPEDLTGATLDVWSFLFGNGPGKALWEEIIENQGVVNRRIEAHCADGRVAVLEMTAQPLRSDHEEVPAAIEGIFRDVSEQVALERERRVHAETLERRVEEKTRQVLTLEAHRAQLEKLAAMGQMAATIVHEIRNPLSSIKIGLTLLLKQRHLQDRDRHTLGLAVDEVEALERILQDILQFAKPLELRRVSHDLNAVAGLALKQMAPELANRGIRIETELTANLPDLFLDVDRVGQVIRNLLINAMQAMNGQGSLTLRSDFEGENQEAVLEITDTGQGMSLEVLERLFEPFFTTRRQGTGLGMTLVEKIVTAHGGRVHVQSREGQGTTVRLAFPTDMSPPSPSCGI